MMGVGYFRARSDHAAGTRRSQQQPPRHEAERAAWEEREREEDGSERAHMLWILGPPRGRHGQTLFINIPFIR